LGWTNCVCDLFQPLQDLKAPKDLDSEVKPTLPPWLSPGWLSCVAHRRPKVPSQPYNQEFFWVSPRDRLILDNTSGLSERSSVTLGRKNGNHKQVFPPVPEAERSRNPERFRWS